MAGEMAVSPPIRMQLHHASDLWCVESCGPRAVRDCCTAGNAKVETVIGGMVVVVCGIASMLHYHRSAEGNFGRWQTL